MIGPNYQINPEKDLIPVCPNCHAMLHRKSPPFLPDEIKKNLEKERIKTE
jgi:5-methylcytosine-specific restriction protein A